MEVTRVFITNIPVIITGNIQIQIAEITAEETKKEEFSDDESFKIECDMQKETIPREENREVMPRLNSEDFSKFFLCQDIFFLTFSYESTHQEVLKNAEISPIILEYL